MANDDIAQQTLLEHEMLKHITDALRVTIAWQVQGGDFSRKLATVRFIALSLQRHLDHMLALEEYDGYMDVVAGHNPRLGRQVDTLRREHDQFRTAVNRIVPHLERASSSDSTEFAKVCEEILALLDKLDEHSRKEIALLQEAFKQEEGGEG